MTRVSSEPNAAPGLPANLTCVALIPARAGSKRIAHKNLRELAGHPLLAYAIAGALGSRVFQRVLVSTESEAIAEVARRYGAEVPELRPAEYAADHSPDIDWVRHVLGRCAARGETYHCFSILRPTSPFRQPATIVRAFQQFVADGQADSLRAVQPCSEHPAKMWRLKGARMTSLLPNPDPHATPWHSTPYQALPAIYVQNASLEIARCEAPLRRGTIAGEQIMPFLTQGLEGFDINLPEDWLLAEHYVRTDPTLLPPLVSS
jgi:CMP-N,N'-diacetyllegionaminic acid synthase